MIALILHVKSPKLSLQLGMKSGKVLLSVMNTGEKYSEIAQAFS